MHIYTSYATYTHTHTHTQVKDRFCTLLSEQVASLQERLNKMHLDTPEPQEPEGSNSVDLSNSGHTPKQTVCTCAWICIHVRCTCSLMQGLGWYMYRFVCNWSVCALGEYCVLGNVVYSTPDDVLGSHVQVCTRTIYV